MYRLAELLEKREDLDGTEQILRACVDAGYAEFGWPGYGNVGWRLAKLLIKQGQTEEASGCAGSASTRTAQ